MLKKQRHASDRGNNRQVRILARIEINETSDNPNRVTRIIPCTDAKVAAGSMQPSRCEISLAYHATPEQNRDDEGHTARSRIFNNLSACVVRNVSGPSRKIGPIAFDHPPKVDPSATPPFLFTLSTIRATKPSKDISIDIRKSEKCSALKRSSRYPRSRRPQGLSASRSGSETSAPSADRTKSSRTNSCWFSRRLWTRVDVW